MKELLSIEEKAKRYDEAIKIAKDSFNYPDYPGFIRADVAFPELKVSEDERIRKALIQYIKDKVSVISGWRKEELIAWLEKQRSKEENLKEHNICDTCEESNGCVTPCCAKLLEKQGEQRPADNVESKFDEDEKIVKDIIAYIRYERKSTQEEIENRFIPWLEKQGERDEERKEINLVEILKHYPKETELYSPLYGKLWLAEVDEEYEIITCYKRPLGEGCVRAILEQEDTVSFYSDGTTGLPDFTVSKDCMLFLYNDKKQGEQKPTDNVEPKFNVGDWIVTPDNKVKQIEKVTFGNYWFTDESLYNITDVDNKGHLWTIQDAKDGDVLSYVTDEGDLWIMIYKSLYEHYEGHVHYHALIFNNDFTDRGTCFIYINNLKPATKEQRDLLFQKMKEAGYEWDAKEKELKKIEQKPVDTPKFKVGDWVVDEQNEIARINQIREDTHGTQRYHIEFTDGTKTYPRLCDADDDYHLWTIQDAKDGDVIITSNGNIFIFKEIRNNCHIYDHCGIYYDRLVINSCVNGIVAKELPDDYKLATKEQCDLMFQKMKESGYEWDAEKKEVKRIEQKSTWSEEDEVMLGNALWACKEKYCSTETYNWLKSLKDRVIPQTKQELSEGIFNEYIDLGLPSGTLWKSFNEDGYYKFDEAVEKFGDLLPTKEQWEELKDKCVWERSNNGYKVTGTNGNAIFLPANGFTYNTEMYGVTGGYYWSRMVHSQSFAFMLYFSDNVHVSIDSRLYGMPVRLVKEAGVAG